MTSLENSMQTKLILIKLALLFIALSLPTSAMSFPGFPRKELSFCPGGGPPGWMNYFDYKRDQNIRRRYSHYQSPYRYKQLPDDFTNKPYPYRPYPYARDYTYQIPPAIR